MPVPPCAADAAAPSPPQRARAAPAEIGGTLWLQVCWQDHLHLREVPGLACKGERKPRTERFQSAVGASCLLSQLNAARGD